MSTHTTARPVIPLDDIQDLDHPIVGGKARPLGALRALEGIDVPPGFCVTTDAFAQAIEQNAPIAAALDRLATTAATDVAEIGRVGETIRRAMVEITVPDGVVVAIADELANHQQIDSWAVRSSATAEDLPAASFAGQHDSYLGVSPRSIVDSIRRCWASLYNERAIRYRLEHGIDHRQVQMAVIVQEQIDADVSGVLFTADPATSDRTVTTIESVPGLGDALVSGRRTPDVHRVRHDRIIDARVAAVGSRAAAALPDSVVLELARLGRAIESHLGCPQDIEWCVEDGRISIVQARPITTLFPIPAAADDANHVYVSVGHQQMMTDAMKPLGVSMWRLTSPAPMTEAGGRLFVDVTPRLAAPASRSALLDVLGRSDPLLRNALETIIERGDFLPPPPPDAPDAAPVLPSPPGMLDADPALVHELIEAGRRSLETARFEIEKASGTDVFDFILEDLQELRRLLFDPQSLQAITTAMDASAWLNEVSDELGHDRPLGNIADALTQSAPNNVTSEMGLALLDVADVIRPHAEVIAHLRRSDGNEDPLIGLADLSGGAESRVAIEDFLDRYGMRCIGEIDITRPRWSERPAALVPAILANVHNFEPGESGRRFARGENEAARAKRDLIARLRSLPDGAHKANQAEQMIDRVRSFIGYREYPKYGMISRYLIYKRAMLREAQGLVDDGVLHTVDDAFFLTFHELRDAVATSRVDHATISERRDAHRRYEHLQPPRVLTSDGECLAGSVSRADIPSAALPGLGVSSGVIEGRARVITDLSDASVAPGDILVTRFTDPSWSPLFVTIAGLVTEVGGYMTHGAVVAREYGLPAVVAVDHATTRIRDGDHIRIDGASGYVEIVEPRTTDGATPDG